MAQRAGGDDVADGLLRLPRTVCQASLPPGQPETVEPAVKTLELESNHHFLNICFEENVPQKQMFLFPPCLKELGRSRLQFASQFHWVLYVK